MPQANLGALAHPSFLQRVLVSLLAAVLVFAVAVPAQAARERTDLEWVAEQLLLDLHNDARTQRGVAPLAEYRDVRDVARSWADQQAASQRMSHNPNFASQICCATRVGENVGTHVIGRSLTEEALKASVRQLHAAYMDSSSHRSNVLDANYRQAGIGISIRYDGTWWRLWNTVNFRAPNGSEPESGLPSSRSIENTCGRSGTSSFRDVPAGNIHQPTIACIEKAGITSGKGDGNYGPKELVSRGQIATFIMRTLDAAGEPIPEGRPCTNGPHAIGMSAMFEWGIFTSGGCDDLAVVTRAEMAAWTVRAMKRPLGWSGPKGDFDYFNDDNNLSGDAQGANNAVAELGVVTGIGNDKFAPSNALRRDQMATFLARLLDAAVQGA